MQRDVFIIIGLAIIAVVIGFGLFPRIYGALPASPAPETTNQPSATTVPFTKLMQGTRSSVATRVNYIITSSTQLEKLWQMVGATSTPPAIDFGTQAVIAVFAGEQPTAGYAIAVAKIEDTAERTVTITLTKPGDGCILAETTTAPYELVSIPIGTLPLAHEDVSVAVDCTI